MGFVGNMEGLVFNGFGGSLVFILRGVLRGEKKFEEVRYGVG